VPKPIVRVDWVFLRDPVLEDYRFSEKTTQLIARPTDLSVSIGTTTLVGVRQRLLECSATVVLRIPSNIGAFKAGLTVFKDELRHGDICYDSAASGLSLELTNVSVGEPRITKKSLNQPEFVAFKITATATAYEFYYREEEASSWTHVGSMLISEITVIDFTGPIFGMFATTLEKEGIPLLFENFDVS
jgi:beta-xylosidase